MLQRAMVMVVYGAGGERLRGGDPSAPRDLPEGGGLFHDGLEVQERHQHLRGKLGPAAEFSGPGDLRIDGRGRQAHARQHLHDTAESGTAERPRDERTSADAARSGEKPIRSRSWWT